MKRDLFAVTILAVLLVGCSPLGTPTTLPTAVPSPSPPTSLPTVAPSPTPSAEPTGIEEGNRYRLQECWNAATTQSEMNACAERQLQYSDQRLEQLLGELQVRLGQGAWQELQAVQERWEAFKAADCGWVTARFEGGSIATMNNLICLDSHNAERIERLKIFLCDGYGMTGPCEASERY